jgi:hypothetical protein
MNFKSFMEFVEIRGINPEEDWEDASKAGAIATISGNNND